MYIIEVIKKFTYRLIQGRIWLSSWLRWENYLQTKIYYKLNTKYWRSTFSFLFLTCDIFIYSVIRYQHIKSLRVIRRWSRILLEIFTFTISAKKYSKIVLSNCSYNVNALFKQKIYFYIPLNRVFFLLKLNFYYKAGTCINIFKSHSNIC